MGVAPKTLNHLLSTIRSHVFTGGRRPQSFFSDFDNLRRGRITVRQFERGLASLMEKGQSLTGEEMRVLAREYRHADDSEAVDYRRFVDDLEGPFVPRGLERRPTASILPPSAILDTHEDHALDAKTRSILASSVFPKLLNWVRYHGATVKSWFQDFDRHHNGLVTRDQFRRSLPILHLLSEEDTEALYRAYLEPANQMFNYVKLNADLHRPDGGAKVKPFTTGLQLALAKGARPSNTSTYHHVPIGTENLLLANDEYESESDLSVTKVEEKLKKTVYKKRIRISEFCKDYDRTNRGLITERQFASALSVCNLDLSRVELDLLADKYGDDSNPRNINYRSFCAYIDTSMRSDPCILAFA